MGTKISLLPNSKLRLIKRGNGNIGIYINDEIIDEKNPILEINPDSTYLEEVKSGYKNRTTLVKRSSIAKSNQEYIIELIDINLLTKTGVSSKIPSQKEPQKLSPYMYLIEDSSYGMTIIEPNNNAIGNDNRIGYKITKNLNLEIDDIKLACFDYIKNPNIYELRIKLENVETIYIYLKMVKARKIEVYNTFYSEMAAGKGFVCVEDKPEDEYIDLDVFLNKLHYHPIIKEIAYISWWEKESKERIEKATQNKIRAKVWPMIQRIEKK